MNALLWLQTAAEYQGNSQGVFANAAQQLQLLKSSSQLTGDLNQANKFGCAAGLPCQALADAALIPAVVLDVDETVLDNSPYQARLIVRKLNFDPATWDEWLNERAARAVPGSVAFINAAKFEGIAVIYITNRQCSARANADDTCPQKADTIANLANAGFPALSDNDLLILRGERPEWNESEKRSRREYVASQYRIMMLMGDDLGDLASDVKQQSIAERAEFVSANASLYGTHWFQLTNPTYGSWTRAFGGITKPTFLRVD